MDDKEIESRLGESLGQRKALFCLEGTEPAEFFEYIKGDKAANLLAQTQTNMLRVDGKPSLLKSRKFNHLNVSSKNIDSSMSLSSSSNWSEDDLSDEDFIIPMIKYQNHLTSDYWIP